MRPFTAEEREAIRDACFRSRKGIAVESDMDLCQRMFKINPEEYAKIREEARIEADATMNPFREG